MTAGDSLYSWLKLTLIPGIGGETQRKLLSGFGLPDAVFSASRSDLLEVVSENSARLILTANNSTLVETACKWSEGDDQHIITLADQDYPRALLEIPDPPSLLYVRGRRELLNCQSLAIVGSRTPTPQGIQNAERFASAFSESGLLITSGLALGIDAAAHRGALAANGNTVAFIGTGIDRIYPARNRDLTIEISKCGAIVSELPIGTPVMASNFPRRNRLISGFSLGVLVVEAAIESGSLITARLACEQDREVFAIPGSIHSPQSRGCHKLIKQGAKLVETAQDVLEELHLNINSTHPEHSFTASEVNFLTNMGFDPCGLDDLAFRTGLTADAISVQLLQMELQGRVAVLPGGRYQQLAEA
ncbi:MAG: DNA-processing protein DprA [Betaproteobacteria bacterium]